MPPENAAAHGGTTDKNGLSALQKSAPRWRDSASEEYDLAARSAAIVTRQSFKGPLPPPEVLAGYERVHPGTADRLIAMAEAESQHRREMERSILQGGLSSQSSHFAEARLGQICAAVIAFGALAAGCYTALSGHDFAGSVLGASGIGGIVTTFIAGRASHRASRQPARISSAPPKTDPRHPRRKR